MNDKFDFLKMEENDELATLSKTDLLFLVQQIYNYYLTYRWDLNLPSKETFGVELEYENIDKLLVDNFVRKNLKGWKSILDETLVSGGEIVSPVLSNKKKVWEELKLICDFLKVNKANTLGNAGLHVHVGMHVLGYDFEAWRKFIKIYILYERVLMRFAFGDKINGRAKILYFARPIGLELLKRLDILDEDISLGDMRKFFYDIYCNKGVALNVRNLYFRDYLSDMNTLEFRHFNVSREATVVQNDINVVVSLVGAAVAKRVDECFLDYKLRNLREQNLSRSDYYKQCGRVMLNEALEFADLIFNSNLDKVYFLRQYIKDFSEEVITKDACLSRGFVK